MRLATILRYLYLAYFSKPVSQRVLYRAIRRTRARRILEIGIGNVARTSRMIGLAARFADGQPVRYAAIDLFEARPAERSDSLTLKEAHRLLKGTPAQIQLIPGEPARALAQVANSLTGVDVLLISLEHDDKSLAGAWFYLPRMLHEGTMVFREVRDEATGAAVLRLLERDEIQALAGRNRRRAA